MEVNLIRKYNVPGPRYTSYPTVPYWDNTDFSMEIWMDSLKMSFSESNKQEGISLYIHLPFCENLCTFCGCHKRITKQHGVEKPYVNALLKEWGLYLELFDTIPKIKEIHLGGGTPTFFSSENLANLMDGLLQCAELADDYEFSFEGHPNHTSKEQLQCLHDKGFRRVSFGVQDYDPEVQRVINRIQPFDNVERVTAWAREIGYTSVSHDLVFGLPKQNLNTISDTIKKTNVLRPDRIAYYSYAHVPWIKGVGQRGFDENDLPKDEEKRALYELGKSLFGELGYVEIGMDHFALPHDSLFKAMQAKTIHRNFMGYTSGKTQLMVGLGMSAISDSWYCFAQNVKTVEEYTALVESGKLPLLRGHKLSDEDLLLRRHILNLMCHFETSWKDEPGCNALTENLHLLEEMVADGLVEIGDTFIKVTDKGMLFVRNICMCLDARMLRNKPETAVFSSTI